MPFYTYTCPDCKATKTLLRKVAERDLLPRCHCPSKGPGNTTLHFDNDEVPTWIWEGMTSMPRDIAGPAFHLKGGGWEKDGYSG
tara:strand:+ start:138 stop:389 length:252 start_codon:yes stop_codon:yes gene_type:complete